MIPVVCACLTPLNVLTKNKKLKNSLITMTNSRNKANSELD